MSEYEWVHIIEITFAGKARPNGLSTVPPIMMRTIDICEKQDYPDLHIDGHPESAARATTMMNNSWMFEGYAIHDDEWEPDNISIERIDVVHKGAEALMGLLTFEEIDTCWQHFCNKKESAPHEDLLEGYNVQAGINLGRARHALLKEAHRLKGYGGGQ